MLHISSLGRLGELFGAYPTKETRGDGTGVDACIKAQLIHR